MQRSVIRLALVFFISGLSLESVYAGLEDEGASSSSSSSSSTSSSSFSSSVSEVYPCVRSDEKLDLSLREAASKGDIEGVKSYIALGANVNAVNRRNFPPLYLAAQAGHLEVVKLLIEAGASVDPRRIADLQLIERNVGDHKNGLGHSALYFAVAEGHIAIIELLLDRDDVDINAQSDNGTPLFAALGNKSSDVFKLLIQRGANVDSESKYGLTVLHVLASKKDTDENHRLFQVVLDRSKNINLQDIDGRTPLHWAVELSNLHAVRQLIAAKANLNLQDKRGYTPLHLAILQGTWKIAKMLINGGADLNILAPGHQRRGFWIPAATALNYALESQINSREKDEVIALLKARGAKTASDLGRSEQSHYEKERDKDESRQSGPSSSMPVVPGNEEEGAEHEAAKVADTGQPTGNATGFSSSSAGGSEPSGAGFSLGSFASFYSLRCRGLNCDVL